MKNRKNTKAEFAYIFAITARYFHITIGELVGRDTKRKYAYPRHIAITLCFNLIEDISMARIGKECGYRTNATVLHACRTISNLCETDKNIAKDFNTLMTLAKTNLYNHSTS